MTIVPKTIMPKDASDQALTKSKLKHSNLWMLILCMNLYRH